MTLIQYLLDTNICAYLLRKKYSIDLKLAQVGLANCHISEITYAELLFGAEHSSQVEKNTALVHTLVQNIDVIPISNAIESYSKNKANLWSIGKKVDDFDILIGSTSIVHDMTLVTENIKHFENMKNIRLENWVKR